MAKSTIGDVISRLRTQTKGQHQDALLTDRVYYSFVLKHAKWLLKREDGKNRLMGYSGVLQTLDYVELTEVDKVSARCTGIKSDCTIKRSKHKMPVFMQGYNGPLIRTVASLDGYTELQPTQPSTFIALSNSKNYRYNKTQYYWYLDDYLWLPDMDWDAVRVEGIFEEDISGFTCESDSCVVRSQQSFNVPDYLLGELEQNVIKDIMGLMQIPVDSANDKQSITR